MTRPFSKWIPSDVEATMCDSTTFQKPMMLAECPAEVRAGFTRKVYMLMCIQLLLTSGISSLLMFEPTVRTFAVHNLAILYAVLIGSMCLMCPLMTYKDVHPLNLILLMVLTILQGYVVGVVCAAYMSVGLGTLIAWAFTTTTLVFGLLSAYVHVSRIELSYVGGTLSAALFALLFLGLVGFFMPTYIIQAVSVALGIVVFSGFVLYDTSMMLHQISVDDAIVASVQLYLDFLNLFLCILNCLSFDS